MKKTAIQIRDQDHVATVVTALEPGDIVHITGITEGRTLSAREAIPVGHKIALHRIGAHEEILKYGEVIGAATADIEAGGWVHVHNCWGLKARRFSSNAS